MNPPKLYALLLGGRKRDDNIMEDHEIVFVVAKSDEDVIDIYPEYSK